MFKSTMLALLLGLGAFDPPQAAPPEFVAVVHASSSLTEITEERLSRIFLKKIRWWESGQPIIVVDQEAGTQVRDAFSSVVHRRTVAAVVAYWQQQIFSGHEAPPPVRHSDQEVLEFVRSNPTAIGYISARTVLVPGVKPLTVKH